MIKTKPNLTLLAIAGVLGIACSSGPAKKSLGDGCVLNSDCSGSLVCTFSRCHEACATSKDCPNNESCVKDKSGGAVCQLPVELQCSHDSDCAAPLVCAADGQCRGVCAQDSDCTAGQKCSTNLTCAEPNQVDSNNNLVAPDGGVLGTGGNSNVGGHGNGGESSSVGGGGTAGSTAASTTGGASSVGGVSNTGGNSAGTAGASVGGVTGNSGGTNSNAGATAGTGGAKPIGGSASTGGAPSVGGATAAGGTSATGGAIATGGTLSTGRASSTGGAVNIGGASAVGGSIATGGALATGGTLGLGGGGTTILTGCAAVTGTLYFCDDFESGLSKWTVSGQDWNTTTSQSRSPTHSATDSPDGKYAAGANVAMTLTTSLDLTATTIANPILSFWYKLSLDASYVCAVDLAYTEVSQDGGVTWSTLSSLCGGRNNTSTWTLLQLSLSAYKGES